MTSPDFMYPQPTDDELAAQQPYTPALGGSGIASGAGQTAGVGQTAGAGRTAGVGQTAGAGQTVGVGHALAPSDNAADSRLPTPDVNRMPIAGASGPRLGKVAFVTAMVAAGLSLFASIVLAVAVGPMEVESGASFTDAAGRYRNPAIALFGLQALCAALGVTGLVMGIVSAVTGRGRTQGVVAIAITALAPFVSFALFLILGFALA